MFKMVIEDRRLSTAEMPVRTFHCHKRLAGSWSMHDHLSQCFIIIMAVALIEDAVFCRDMEEYASL